MRIGLREMKALSKLLFPSVKDSTFFESCGVADVITTCCKDCELSFCSLLSIVKVIALLTIFFTDYYSRRKKPKSCRSICPKWRKKV